MVTTQTLPHWDMSVVYPGLDSPEFDQGFKAVVSGVNRLGDLFDDLGIALREPAPLTGETVSAFDRAMKQYNEVLDGVGTMSAYINAFFATDSRNNLAQAKLSELQQHLVRLSQLGTRFTAWIGSLDVDGLLAESSEAQEHEFVVRQAQIRASHLMSPPEEALSSELNVSSGSAWGKLHNNVTSQIVVPLERDGETQSLPMSVIRSLAFEPERDVRRRAYEAELAAWERTALPLASALNSIKGEVITLAKHANGTRLWTPRCSITA